MSKKAEPLGKEYLDALVRIANTGMHHAYVAPLGSLVTGFFKQFTPRAVENIFPAVNLACRQLDEGAPQGIAKLPLEDNSTVAQQGHYNQSDQEERTVAKPAAKESKPANKKMSQI